MLRFRRPGSIRYSSRTRKIVRRVCATVGAGTALALPLGGGPAFAATDAGTSCASGQFCFWSGEHYRGAPQPLDLSNARASVCVPLPEGAEARSFVNNREGLITVYEGEHCSTHGDFTTYPGGGTYVPESPFVVRAVEIWD